MSARSTRASKRGVAPVAMVTTQADIHVAADEIESVHSPDQSPAPSPVRPPAKPVKRKASNTKKTQAKSQNKRVTVYELSQTVYSMQESADRQEARVERVEGRMDGMDSKLDFIVSALGKDKSNNNVPNDVSVSRSRPISPSTSAGRVHATQHAGRTPQHDTTPVSAAPPALAPLCPLPGPAALVAEQNREGALDSLMSRQNFKPSDNNGKRVSYGDCGMPKPYMFLEREGLQTNRQKLDVRCAMTSDEYMYCALALLHEKDSHQPEDKNDILLHVFAVATDILTRPWPAVRRWTNYVWDSVEKGRCKWNDYLFIQDARVRLSYMTAPAHLGGGSGMGPRQGAPGSGSEYKSVVCPDFNAPQGCAFSSTHDDGMIRYTHACAHCNALGRRSAHSFQRCRTRIEAQTNNGGTHSHSHQSGDARPWGQSAPRNQTHGQSLSYGNRSGHGYGQAKNGY